jgi:hypothetical protein
VASHEARAQLQEQLAVALAEKRAANELTRIDDARAAERSASCDTAVLERNKAVEAAAAATTTTRALEDSTARLEQQLKGMREAQAVLEARAGSANEKADEARKQRESVQAAREAAEAACSTQHAHCAARYVSRYRRS